MAFYDKFEELCKAKGITPTRAARENGLAQSVISMWKTRGSTPQAATVQKLADYFGVTVDYLLCWNDNIQQAKEIAANTPDDAISDVGTDDLAIFDRICQLTGHYTRPKLDDLSGYYLGKRGEETAEKFLTNKEFREFIKLVADTTAAMIDSKLGIAKD